MLRHITALEFDSEHIEEALEGSGSAWHTRPLLGKAITTGQVAAFLVEGGAVLATAPAPGRDHGLRVLRGGVGKRA